LLELALLSGSVGVVLVRRVGGPAPGGGDDLAGEDLLGGGQGVGHAEAAHLTAARAGPPQLDGHPGGGHDDDLTTATGCILDPSAAQGDAAGRLPVVDELEVAPGGGVERVARPGEDAGPAGEPVPGAVHDHRRAARERHDDALLPG